MVSIIEFLTIALFIKIGFSLQIVTKKYSLNIDSDSLQYVYNIVENNNGQTLFSSICKILR